MVKHPIPLWKYYVWDVSSSVVSRYTNDMSHMVCCSFLDVCGGNSLHLNSLFLFLLKLTLDWYCTACYFCTWVIEFLTCLIEAVYLFGCCRNFKDLYNGHHKISVRPVVCNNLHSTNAMKVVLHSINKLMLSCILPRTCQKKLMFSVQQVSEQMSLS